MPIAPNFEISAMMASTSDARKMNSDGGLRRTATDPRKLNAPKLSALWFRA